MGFACPHPGLLFILSRSVGCKAFVVVTVCTGLRGASMRCQLRVWQNLTRNEKKKSAPVGVFGRPWIDVGVPLTRNVTVLSSTCVLLPIALVIWVVECTPTYDINFQQRLLQCCTILKPYLLQLLSQLEASCTCYCCLAEHDLLETYTNVVR